MVVIEEPTGLDGWQLVITREDDMVKVAIQGPRGGEKAFVRVFTEDLENAVRSELVAPNSK